MLKIKRDNIMEATEKQILEMIEKLIERHNNIIISEEDEEKLLVFYASKSSLEYIESIIKHKKRYEKDWDGILENLEKVF